MAAIAFAFVLIAIAWSSGPVAGQELFNNQPIGQIRVEGAQRIEPETVRSYMQIVPGDRFEPMKIDNALKNLYATGLFADVTLKREGDVLVVQVVENPIINRLAFEGNRRIDDKTLEAEVQLRPRVVYTQTRVQNDANRILDIYRRSGRFAATVNPKVIPLDQNRVDLVFEINEGDVTRVERIDFVGNTAFSDGELRDQILTKESAWYRFLSTSDTYDPDRLTADREALRTFYLKEGYADFRVLSAVAELSPDRDAFFITFTVEEGERYRFGTIGIQTTLKDLDPETLRSQITTEEGDWYDASKVENSIAKIADAVGTLGYAFVDVRPRFERDRENKVINLVYDIQEGPRVYVQRIDINGNVRTLDKVIRREFRLVEGDPFNTAKLRRTRQRIQNLGFFKTVDIKTLPGDTPDKTVIQVDVEEQSTGELTFGLGFSTAEGPLGDITIRERNLLGRGWDLRNSLSLSGRRTQIDHSFTDPYFLDMELAAGWDLFRITLDRRESSFSEENIGGGLRAGYDISEYLRQTWRYTLARNKIYNVDNNASLAIQQQSGTALESVIGQELLYDRRDSRFDPHEGYYIRLRNDFAGLGGDSKYARQRLGAGYYIPLSEDLTVGFVGEIGDIIAFGGEDIRITDAFFVGGQSLRGFRTAGIGPRDQGTNDALGGNKFATGTVELAFPLPLPDEYPVRGRIFSDFGTLFDTDAGNTKGVNVEGDKPSLRLSAGAGLTWRSPFGPLAVDFALPVLREEFDKEEFFRFSVGTQF